MLLLSGAVRGSKYGVLGSFRVCSQAVRYEVVFSLVLYLLQKSLSSLEVLPMCQPLG